MKTATKIARNTLFMALVAAGMSSHAYAQSSEREQALEARVAELERLVQTLVSQQQHTENIEEIKTAQAQAITRPEGKTAIQNVTLTPAAAPETTLRLGGFIKADFMSTHTSDGQLADSAVGRVLYLPSQTPVGGDSSNTDFDAHAKFSRVNLGIDSVTEAGNKMGAFFEVDFFGNSLGNQNATNTYGVTMRHAYMYWNKWLAGQTWSNMVDLPALPEAVDFIGPTDGALFVRQAQLRYTHGNLTVALENPETLTIPHLGGALTANDRGALPDLTMRYTWKGSWGHVGVAALLRELNVDRPGFDDSVMAGGLSVSGRWNLSSTDDIRYQFNVGDGMSRYIGLGVTGDAMLDRYNELHTISSTSGYVGWRHAFSPTLRSNLIFARSQYDNEPSLTGGAATKSVQSLRANLMYSPLPKVDIGAEIMVGKREIESGADGEITRLQFTTKYSF